MPREIRAPFVGDVVEITSLKCPQYVGKQGVVMRVNEKKRHKDGQIRVRFPKIYTDLPRWFDDEVPYRIWFETEDFRLRPGGFCIDPKVEARAIWRQMAHSFQWPKHPLIPGKTRCHFEGCQKPAFFRIWYNYCGSVAMYYVCAEHAKYHMIAGEDAEFSPELSEEEIAAGIPPEMSVAQQAKTLFGESWRVNRPETFFVPNETICVHKSCRLRAAFQILVNCWGSIYQMDVCRNHASLHGARMDEVPYKPAISQSKFIIEDQINLDELAHA